MLRFRSEVHAYQVIAVAAARRRHSGLECLTPTAVVGVVKERHPAGGRLFQLAGSTQCSKRSEEDNMYGLHSCSLRRDAGAAEANKLSGDIDSHELWATTKYARQSQTQIDRSGSDPTDSFSFRWQLR